MHVPSLVETVRSRRPGPDLTELLSLHLHLVSVGQCYRDAVYNHRHPQMNASQLKM